MMKVGHECQICEATSQLAQHIFSESTAMLNNAIVEIERSRVELDQLRSQLATVTLYAQRTTAQLRDEERENAALRRRLREGGR
jgi:hypothetical protein